MYSSITLRAARPDDAAALLEIYAPYVTGTAISFEYDVPSVEEFRARIEHTLKKYPYIVAESGGEIVGYAYTGEFKERAAYGWSVETSIYVARGKKRCGIGKRLYRALEDISRLQNILNLNACIAYPHEEDEYLTKNSVQFHEHLALANSTTAAINSAGGTAWCGWKSLSGRILTPPPPLSRSQHWTRTKSQRYSDNRITSQKASTEIPLSLRMLIFI